MRTFRKDLKEMRSYLPLWFTQLVSGLGSAMTAYAMVIRSYTQAGSALRTALLKNNVLRIWHLYIVNAVSGLMNTVQQPAGEALWLRKRQRRRLSRSPFSD